MNLIECYLFYVYIERSRESGKERRGIVDMLLDNSKKSSNYGRPGMGHSN